MTLSCVICNKHKNLENAIYEDENWVVTHGPLDSQIIGYFYIEPKRHVENWSEFSVQELGGFGNLIKRLEIAMKKRIKVDRVYVVTISEAVRHLHFHIIPRIEEMDVKGLTLIEQATQQNIRTKQKINKEDLLAFLDNFSI